jgi:O-antigen/teichoic acid export membrane protein
MSYRIPELLIRSLNNVLGNVSLASLAITQSDRQKMRKFYFGYIRFIAMFTFPVSMGLAFTAPVFIPLFLSDKWGPAIVPTALISIALCITGLGYVPGVLYKAVGRPDILNKLAIIKMPIAVFILWYATRWGIVGVAAGQIVLALISVSMDILVANSVMNYSFSDVVEAVSPSLISTLAMSLVLYLISQMIPERGLVQFIFMVALGALTYFVAFWAISRETLLQGVNMVRSMVSRKKTTIGGQA